MICFFSLLSSLLLVLKYSFVSWILSHPPFFVHSQNTPAIIFLSSSYLYLLKCSSSFHMISHLFLSVLLSHFLFLPWSVRYSLYYLNPRPLYLTT